MIVAYAISKNESKKVEQFVENTKLFDKVFVLDTGSTDDTVSLLRKNNITVFEKSYDQFDFSLARNYCLSRLPYETNWCVWLDFNETIKISQPQIQSILDNDQASAYYGKCFLFNYDEHQYVGIENKIKIHKLSQYRWVRPVHEELKPLSDNLIILESDIEFYKDSPPCEQKESFYYDICYREHVKGSNDSIYLRFLLDYSYNRKQWEDVEKFASLYLNKTEGTNNYFRPRPFLLLSEYYLNAGQLDSARDMAFHALSESIKQKKSFFFWLRDSINQLKKLGVEIKVNDTNR